MSLQQATGVAMIYLSAALTLLLAGAVQSWWVYKRTKQYLPPEKTVARGALWMIAPLVFLIPVAIFTSGLGMLS
jgi:UPF0716 family protein affecting phage T7 exclusion